MAAAGDAAVAGAAASSANAGTAPGNGGASSTGGSSDGGTSVAGDSGTSGVGGSSTGGTTAGGSGGGSGEGGESGCTSCLVVTEQGELRTNDDPTGGVGTTVKGYSISMSPDGNTALVGAPMKGDANGRPGAVYVFTRTGSTWTEQAALTASDGANNDNFGYSVALSADGRTALVGAPEKTVASNSGQGAAYVFTLDGSTWTEKTVLTESVGSSYNRFGSSVSLSSDGSTALVGAEWISGPGAALVFTLSDSAWAEQTKLTASDGDKFGHSTALSSDGNTAFVGHPSSHDGAGDVHVFVRGGSTWTEQSAFGIGADVAALSFGWSLSLSSDDTNLLVGAPGGYVGGAALLFGRTGSTWAQQHVLTSSDAEYRDNFGYSVSLSSGGSTALVGAYYKSITFSTESGQVTNEAQGAAYVFRRVGSTWQEEEVSLGASGEAGDWFGFAVAISSDGSIGIVTTSNDGLEPLVGYGYSVSEP